MLYEEWLRKVATFDPSPHIDLVYKRGRPYRALFYLAALGIAVAAVPLIVFFIPLWLVLVTVACPLAYLSNLDFLPIQLKLLLKVLASPAVLTTSFYFISLKMVTEFGKRVDMPVS